MNEKIERMLASQWDSRLRKVDNKFVKTNSRIPSPGKKYKITHSISIIRIKPHKLSSDAMLFIFKVRLNLFEYVLGSDDTKIFSIIAIRYDREFF